MQSFFAGLLYPFRAFGLIARTPRMWRYIVVPMLVNVVVAAGLYGGLLFLGLRQIDAQIGAATGLAAIVAALLRVLLIVGLLIVIGFLLVRFGVVLGSPWYSQLSEHLEQQLTGHAPPAEPLTIRGIARDLGRALAFEAKKLVLVIAIGVLLLLVNLVPGFGQAASAVGGFALGALIACLDFFDGPLERRRLSFRAKLRAVRNGMPASAGFGLVAFALVSVPFVNLLSIPVCVAAGTLFFCERLRRGRSAR
jgi:CysZ protein